MNFDALKLWQKMAAGFGLIVLLLVLLLVRLPCHPAPSLRRPYADPPRPAPICGRCRLAPGK